MTSPFPGMDPYIEAAGLWRDFHARLIGRILEALETTIPDRYRVRTDLREVVELVETEGKAHASMYPDVKVTGEPRATSNRSTGVAVAEAEPDVAPYQLEALITEEFRERFIEILTVEPQRRLVTCIEVLSPTNKRLNSDSRSQYLRKRQALFLGDVNLVEIDLLRGGEPMPMRAPWSEAPYRLLVGRAGSKGQCQVWPAHFRKPLPRLPVPLDPPDADLSLDLQPMIAAIYERSRYGADLDYSQPLDPPLSEQDTAWLREQVEARKSLPHSS